MEHSVMRTLFILLILILPTSVWADDEYYVGDSQLECQTVLATLNTFLGIPDARGQTTSADVIRAHNTDETKCLVRIMGEEFSGEVRTQKGYHSHTLKRRVSRSELRALFTVLQRDKIQRSSDLLRQGLLPAPVFGE